MVTFLALLGSASAQDHFLVDGQGAQLKSLLQAAPTSGDPSAYRVFLAPGTYTAANISINSDRAEVHALVPGTVTIEGTGQSGGNSKIFNITNTGHLRLFDVDVDASGQRAVDINHSATFEATRVRMYAGNTNDDARGGLIDQNGNASVILVDSHLRDSSANRGGLINQTGGALQTSGTLFESGSASEFGGCVYTSGGTQDFVDTRFLMCDSADDGGALHLDFTGTTAATFDGAWFEENDANVWGGAIYSRHSLDIQHSIFCLNTSSTRSNGGIYWEADIDDMTLDVQHTAFLNNGSSNDGWFGGILRAFSDGANDEVFVTFADNSMSGNVADGATLGRFDIGWPSTVDFHRNQVTYNTIGSYHYAFYYYEIVDFEDNNFFPGGLSYDDGNPTVTLSGNTTQNPGFSSPASSSCNPLDIRPTNAGDGAFSTSGLQDADGDLRLPPFDCDDTDATVHPDISGDTTCDGVDDDCDFEIDEDASKSEHYLDRDGDGFGDPAFPVDACGPQGRIVDNADDCDDTDAGIVPIAYYLDTDDDGYGDQGSSIVGYTCALGANQSATNDDCDDSEATVFPGNPEICDGLDNDCAGGVDDGLTFSDYYLDGDTDGYGAGGPVSTCDGPPAGYVTDNTDCNDGVTAINPGASETCDGLDNDCVGGVDDGLTFSDYYLDGDSDGYGAGSAVSTCDGAPVGYVTDNTDCNDAITAINPGATEVCDGLDNDCIGGPDDGLTFADYYNDGDSDGYGAGSAVSTCDGAPAGHVTDNTDCNDGAAAINPGATEVCNGIDDDCVGGPDDGLAVTTYYEDGDGDGYGRTTQTSSTCDGVPAGYASDPGDCNDGNAAINPGASETCNGIDDNCVGGTDEGLPTVPFFADADADGYPDTSDVQNVCEEQQPVGYIPARVDGRVDCDDTTDLRNPGNPEVCDDLDNNCSGIADDGLLFTLSYRDQDDDGFGDPLIFADTCDGPPAGYVDNDDDCDDTDEEFSPDVEDTCDGDDNDCSGVADDGPNVEFVLYYPDTDGDGYGDSGGSPLSACDGAPVGYVDNDEDCDDTASAINPDATEICDGIDNDCNGLTDLDDGLERFVFYADRDGDTYGDESTPAFLCVDIAPDGYVEDSTDCLDDPAVDPAAPNANPAAIEVCDGIDNDCDMLIDSADTEFLAADWFIDTDGDGYGDSSQSETTCSPQAGWVNNSFDCDDTDAGIFPLAADDDCDGVDENCNTLADEEAPELEVYPDADGDGEGANDAQVETVQCPDASYVATNTDCDDDDASVNTAAADDTCDGVDSDCDGLVDEHAPEVPITVDQDGDSYFADSDETAQCPGEQPEATDCDDGSADVHPDAVESCGDVDYNCNGLTGDEELGETCGEGPPVETLTDYGPGCSTGAAAPSWLFSLPLLGLLLRRRQSR